MTIGSGGGDEEFLLLAIRLAADNVNEGSRPFGAVVVRDGALLATGVNRVGEDLDPTAHAEVMAIRAACQAAGTVLLTGCTLYASCEPCPMCLAAAMWARVDRVVFGATRHEAEAAGFDDARLYRELERPADRRSVPTVHLEVPAPTLPFDLWMRR